MEKHMGGSRGRKMQERQTLPEPGTHCAEPRQHIRGGLWNAPTRFSLSRKASAFAVLKMFGAFQVIVGFNFN